MMPGIVYNNNIPQAIDEPSDSQPQLLENTNSVETFLEVNHVTFVEDDYGKHKFVTMPLQVADPTTLATEGAIYAATGNYSGILELFFRRPSDATPIPFTETNGTGFTFLPSGILVKWGNTNKTGYTAPDNVVTFPAGPGIPAFLATPKVFLTITLLTNNPLNANKAIALGQVTPINFEANCFQISDRAATQVFFSWLAIGL